MNKLAVFDFDSTLLDGESINLVLEQILSDPMQKETLEQIRVQGMLGNISLKKSLESRIVYFKGLKLSQLEKICQGFAWTSGAIETIEVLKQRGYLTLCLSGGFQTATRRVMTELGVDAYCCNRLSVNNGILTGHISGQLMQHSSKGKILKQVQTRMNISPENTLVVGDGANDLSLFNHAKLKIAFCAQEILKKQATVIIEQKDLREVIKFLS